MPSMTNCESMTQKARHNTVDKKFHTEQLQRLHFLNILRTVFCILPIISILLIGPSSSQEQGTNTEI